MKKVILELSKAQILKILIIIKFKKESPSQKLIKILTII
jgi:hypothetical protein